MYITDSQNSPLKNISDINGQLAYRGQVISGSAGIGSLNINYIQSQYAIVRSTTGGQYIAAGLPDYVPIIFNSGDKDTNNFFNLSTPTKLNIKENGIYLIDSIFSFSAGSIDDRLGIRVNGNNYINNSNNSVFSYRRKSINALSYLNSGDYVEIVCYPNTNITLDAPSSSFRWPEVRIAKISYDQIPSGAGGTGSSNLPANATGYLYNDGNGNFSWKNFIGAKVILTGNYLIENATRTGINWQSGIYDTNIFWDNKSKFIIPSGLDGKYMIGCNLIWENNNGGVIRQFEIKKNNETPYLLTEGKPQMGASYYVGQSAVKQCQLKSNDFIEIICYQDCGTNLNLKYDLTYGSENSFWIQKL